MLFLRVARLVLYGSAAAGIVAGVAGARAGDPRFLPVGVGFFLADVLGAGLALWAGRHPGLDARTRSAWRLVGLALVLLTVSDALRPVWPPGSWFPSPADLIRLAFAPVLLAGLLMLPLRGQDRRDRLRTGMDTGVVVTAAAMLLWYLEVEPAVTGAHLPGAVVAAAIAYPVTDLALVFGAAVVLIRGAARSARRPVGLLAAGVLLLCAGDATMGYQLSHTGTATGRPWQFACWFTGTALLGLAAAEQCLRAGGHRLAGHGRRLRPVSPLPYLALGFGYVLLVLAAARFGFFPLGGLVLGAVVMTSLVVARQVLAQRETHEMAVTDGLTGLVNRARVHDALRLALVRGQRSREGVAVLLLDMNGFKEVNDALGHDAGDQLLVAFGGLLRRNVLGSDVVGRLGGDEFAAVLHHIGRPEDAVAVAQRIVADMDRPVVVADTPIQPRASIGIALSGPGELTPEELLHRADLAMYRAKRSRTTGYELYVSEPTPN